MPSKGAGTPKPGWSYQPGTYLGGFPSDIKSGQPNSYPSLVPAQIACQGSSDCGGVTKAGGSNSFQARKGKLPTTSPSGENSWVKPSPGIGDDFSYGDLLSALLSTTPTATLGKAIRKRMGIVDTWDIQCVGNTWDIQLLTHTSKDQMKNTEKVVDLFSKRSGEVQHLFQERVRVQAWSWSRPWHREEWTKTPGGRARDHPCPVKASGRDKWPWSRPWHRGNPWTEQAPGPRPRLPYQGPLPR